MNENDQAQEQAPEQTPPERVPRGQVILAEEQQVNMDQVWAMVGQPHVQVDQYRRSYNRLTKEFDELEARAAQLEEEIAALRGASKSAESDPAPNGKGRPKGRGKEEERPELAVIEGATEEKEGWE